MRKKIIKPTILSEETQKELRDMMTAKKPKIIDGTVNDGLFRINVFPMSDVSIINQLMKELIPIMSKYKVSQLEAYFLKKWTDDPNDTTLGEAKKV